MKPRGEYLSGLLFDLLQGPVKKKNMEKHTNFEKNGQKRCFRVQITEENGSQVGPFKSIVP